MPKSPLYQRTRAAVAALAVMLFCAQIALAADAAPKRWSESDLVASYKELAASGGLEAAVRMPSLPKDPPQPAFLEALAWYAAGTPAKAGTLTLKQLDEQIAKNVNSYMGLLKAKVENGTANDYPRTRTWKVVQKYTMLRDEMAKPASNGQYAYAAMGKAPAGTDPWETAHTLKSSEEFAEKVCRASYKKPVLVKYGNTNCTQCMLFEIIGSVKEFAESPALKDVDVYKLWFGFEPDESFTGKIRKPERLDALAKDEGVTSSPTFVLYRNGARHSCGDAFPDENGRDEKLEACLKDKFEAAPAGICATTASGGAQ